MRFALRSPENEQDNLQGNKCVFSLFGKVSVPHENHPPTQLGEPGQSAVSKYLAGSKILIGTPPHSNVQNANFHQTLYASSFYVVAGTRKDVLMFSSVDGMSDEND